MYIFIIPSLILVSILVVGNFIVNISPIDDIHKLILYDNLSFMIILTLIIYNMMVSILVLGK